MIADDREGLIEMAVKLLTAPVWWPIYVAYLGFCKLRETRKRDPNVKVEDLGLRVWTPVTDLERTVYAAMILAGRPVTNAELARLMDCSPGEASKRVKALEGVLRKDRIGREVRISLPAPYH